MLDNYIMKQAAEEEQVFLEYKINSCIYHHVMLFAMFCGTVVYWVKYTVVCFCLFVSFSNSFYLASVCVVVIDLIGSVHGL